MDIPASEFHGNHTAASIPLHHQIDNLEFVKKSHAVLDTLLVKGLKDHMTRAIRRIAGPPDRRLAKIPGMTAEAPLVDPSLGSAIKRQPPVFKIIDHLNRFFRQNQGCLLIDQIVAAFYRVKGMPLGFVFFHIS